MNTTLEIEGKSIHIELSAAATEALDKRKQPLLAEMELYFSCFIRKKVRFREATMEAGQVSVNDGLKVRFRPVMTQQCGKDYEGDEPPLTDFPIVKSRPYIPRWLRIDFHRGEWVGEFGYTNF